MLALLHITGPFQANKGGRGLVSDRLLYYNWSFFILCRTVACIINLLQS